MKKLKKCLCCGSEDLCILDLAGSYYKVACKNPNCSFSLLSFGGVAKPFYKTKKEAITAWNNRWAQ